MPFRLTSSGTAECHLMSTAYSSTAPAGLRASLRALFRTMSVRNASTRNLGGEAVIKLYTNNAHKPVLLMRVRRENELINPRIRLRMRGSNTVTMVT
jgi:hypothetical protein